MCFSRPHCACKRRTVCVFTKIIVLNSFLVNAVTLLNFYTSVYNGYKVDILISHLFYKSGEIGKRLRVNCKVFVMIHVVDVKINTVERNMVFPVLMHNFTNFICTAISPSALTIAKCPLGRNIASAYQLAELVHNVFQTVSMNDVQI